MITDNPQDMERQLVQYVKDAREALETLHEIGSPETKAEQDRYIAALNKLNTSRVWLGMAAEQLHDLLNEYNDILIEAQQEAGEER